MVYSFVRPHSILLLQMFFWFLFFFFFTKHLEIMGTKTGCNLMNQNEFCPLRARASIKILL